VHGLRSKARSAVTMEYRYGDTFIKVEGSADFEQPFDNLGNGIVCGCPPPVRRGNHQGAGSCVERIVDPFEMRRFRFDRSFLR
jgi:hypothetical protein